MNANELRIGNYVYNRQNELHEIGFNCFQKFRTPTMDGNPSGFTPIPLTEEILLRCGFKLHSQYSFWNYVLDNHFCLSMWAEETQVAGFEKKGSFYWGERLKEIKYLHELQNLLFALHGIELILNQDK